MMPMEVWGGYGARGGGHGALSEVDMPSITFKRLFMVEVIFERLTLACCSYRCAHINPPYMACQSTPNNV